MQSEHASVARVPCGAQARVASLAQLRNEFRHLLDQDHLLASESRRTGKEAGSAVSVRCRCVAERSQQTQGKSQCVVVSHPVPSPTAEGMRLRGRRRRRHPRVQLLVTADRCPISIPMRAHSRIRVHTPRRSRACRGPAHPAPAWRVPVPARATRHWPG